MFFRINFCFISLHNWLMKIIIMHSLYITIASSSISLLLLLLFHLCNACSSFYVYKIIRLIQESIIRKVMPFVREEKVYSITDLFFVQRFAYPRKRFATLHLRQLSFSETYLLPDM